MHLRVHRFQNFLGEHCASRPPQMFCLLPFRILVTPLENGQSDKESTDQNISPILQQQTNTTLHLANYVIPTLTLLTDFTECRILALIQCLMQLQPNHDQSTYMKRACLACSIGTQSCSFFGNVCFALVISGRTHYFENSLDF